MPVMPERLVVVALKFLGNEVFFELYDLFRRQDTSLDGEEKPSETRAFLCR
jgi:hypothetical protein